MTSDHGPRYPSEVSTRDRGEMVCPECFTQGLEPNPGYADEYTGDTELLKATRCPNEDCPKHYGLDPGEVEEQLAGKSILERLGIGGETSSDSSESSNTTTQTQPTSSDSLLPFDASLAEIAVVGIGIILLLTQVIGISLTGGLGVSNPFDKSQSGVEVTGTVNDPSGAPVSDVKLVFQPKGEPRSSAINTTTRKDGTYKLKSVEHGTYSVYVGSGEHYSAPGFTVSVGDDGVTVQNTTVATYNDGLVINLQNATRVSKEAIRGNTSTTLHVTNPLNMNDVTVRLEPISGDQTEAVTAVQAGQSKTFNIPGSVTEQVMTVDTSVTEKDAFETYTYTDSRQSVTVLGNLYPGKFVINVSNQAGLPVQQKTWNVSDGDTRDITVKGGQTRGDVVIEVFGGKSTANSQKTGVWKGTDPRFTVDNESAPSTTTVQLTGDLETEQKSVTGKLAGGLITYFVEGNLPAGAAVIEFNGGVPENTSVTSSKMSLTGENGTRERVRKLIRVEKSGKYRIDTTLEESKNPEYVSGGYIINSNRNSVSGGQDSKLVTLEKGDYVYTWLKTERDTVGGEKSYSDNSPVIIQETIVSDTSIAPGETVDVYAKLYNPSTDTATKDAVLFKDASRLTSYSVSLNSGEERRIKLGTIQFDSKGAHTVSVSEDEQVVIEVGNPPEDYGVGSLSTELVRIGGEGTVKVDTNGDGTLNCAVSADGGKCPIGEVPKGSNTLVVAQEGVKKTSYTLSYTSRQGAKGITVDIDGDGNPDMRHAGILRDGQTISETFQVDAGTTRVDIKSQNGGDVPYNITWTKAQVVKNPTIYVDGKKVISDVGSFKGKKTFEIDGLSSGTHTLQFGSGGKEYSTTVRWTEQGDSRFPEAEVAGQTVCQPQDFADNLKCTVRPSSVPPGTHTIEFDGGADKFKYGISQTAKATPKRLTVSLNKYPIQFQRASAELVRDDGSWKRTKTVTKLSEGKNQVSVSAPTINGIPVSAAAKISYTFTVTPPKEPRVIVVNSNDEQHERTVPKSALNTNGHLSQTHSMSLPANWFTEGENKVYIVTKNGGVFRVTITAPETVTGGNISFSAPSD